MNAHSGIRLSILNKELEESFAGIASQHGQIRWFVQTYLLALFGLFTLTGFIVNTVNIPSSGNDPTKLKVAVGISCSISLFILGWLLLSVLARKIATLTIIYKHIAVCRRARLQFMKDQYHEEYFYSTNADEILLPGMIRFMPYCFFVLNYMVLCGGLFFYAYFITDDLNLSSVLSLTIGTIVGLFYPNVCIIFNKHIITAIKATSFSHKKKLEESWDDLRKRFRKDSWYVIALLVTLALGSVLLLIIAVSHHNRTDLSWEFWLALLDGTLFAALLYYFEKDHLKNIKKAMEGK